MMHYTTGDILEARAEALVNTVNCVGVMGKGLALQFKQRYPENFRAYQLACRLKQVRIGTMFLFEMKEPFGPHWIINFPTKQHWKNPSKLEWIRAGLRDLVWVIQKQGIRSVALPALGCQNGGLSWGCVQLEIHYALDSQLPEVEITVYGPRKMKGSL